MASGPFSSLQCLSSKLLDVVRGSEDDPNHKKSIEQDLKWLSQLLRRIEAVQQDAEDREIRDRSVELWLMELRGVAHEAEDVLDEYHYEVLKSTVLNRSMMTETESSHIGSKRKIEEMCTQSSLASSSSKIMIPDGMTDNIKRIRELFEEISRERDALHLREGDGERRILGPQNRPHTSSLIDEKSLFGWENEKEKIISLITPANGPDFVVLPIVGKGGLGKTTLAQLVYNDSELNQLFDKRAWVSVSENFDIVRLTRAIIESITKNPCGFSELNQLQDVLKEKLANIRLFLVLDDVWNEKNNLWESFRNVFNGAKAVKILATTRNYSVAKIMQTIQPFELGHLPEDICWMIFKHHAFRNQEINTNLMEIGRDIVKKCKGLPLYVKVLGGLLRYETDEKWREVLESETWAVDEKNEIMSALSFSYYYMPLHLRSCFLYLSTFPKDRKLEKDMVVKQWMAHGYINTRPNKTLEDIGCEYFEELRCRSLIDYVNDDYYVLHDLLHDLAVSINKRPWDSSFPIYHLYLSKENTVPNYITRNNHRSVRTLLGFGLDVPQIDHTMFLSMVCLRVLELRVDYAEFRGGFRILKHLRYLKVYNYELKILTETLCVLYNLQTLELDCDSLRELPTNIGNLISLRHLSVSSEIEQLPESICYLCNLQMLKLDCDSFRELPTDIGNLINLRHLSISSEKIEQLPESICYLCNLQILQLDCDSLRELPKDIENLISLLHLSISSEIEQLPESICYLCNLQMLKLSRCYKLKELPSRIEQLMSLHELSLSHDSGINIPSGFHKLTNLRTLLGTLYVRGDALDRGLGELKFMNNLGGSLSIQGLENITNVEYAKEASLKSKSNLKYLELDFLDSEVIVVDFSLKVSIQDPGSTGSFKKNNEIQEYVLESLEPHGNLKALTIRNYIGTKFPSWLGDHSSLPKLTELSLFYCHKINFLPSLKFLVLEKLTLGFMFEWYEWTVVLDDDLPRLKTLTIECCPNLRKIPTIPNNVQNLHIKSCGLHEIRLPLSFTMKNMEISNCKDLTLIIGLHDQKSLTSLTLTYCPLLEIPVDCFLQSITARIMICDCPRLDITISKHVIFYMRDDTSSEFNEDEFSKDEFSTSALSIPKISSLLVCAKEVLASPFLEQTTFQKCIALDMPILEELKIGLLPLNLESFKYLKHLCIISCPKMHYWEDEYIQEMVEYLEVSCCHELITVPALDKNISLLEIRISNCPKLRAIRAWRCLFSLRTLVVKDCQELKEMPNEMLKRRPQTIHISNCPWLKDWCQLNDIPLHKDGEG